jgi:hypothetical protein
MIRQEDICLNAAIISRCAYLCNSVFIIFLSYDLLAKWEHNFHTL